MEQIIKSKREVIDELNQVMLPNKKGELSDSNLDAEQVISLKTSSIGHFYSKVFSFFAEEETYAIYFYYSQNLARSGKQQSQLDLHILNRALDVI